MPAGGVLCFVEWLIHLTAGPPEQYVIADDYRLFCRRCQLKCCLVAFGFRWSTGLFGRWGRGCTDNRDMLRERGGEAAQRRRGAASSLGAIAACEGNQLARLTVARVKAIRSAIAYLRMV